MPAKGDEEKLRVLLDHWVEHNRGHAREFQDWAERADALGHGRVAQGIRRAARKMDEANALLRESLVTLEER